MLIFYENKNIQKGPIIDFLPHQSIRLFACDPHIIQQSTAMHPKHMQQENEKRNTEITVRKREKERESKR